MRERAYRPTLVGPLILITLGVLLLLNQMGRLPWDVLWSLWRYWPVILILLGIEVLIGISQSRLLYLLGLLVAIAIIVGLVGYAMIWGQEAPAERPVTDTEMISRPLQDADRGLVMLRLGAGSITVGALADSPSLVEGKIEYAEQSKGVEEHFAVQNGRAEFELRSRQENLLWIPGTKMNEAWRLQVTPRIPLEMRVEMGAGSIQADLRDLKVTDLQLNMGAGDVLLTLPSSQGATTIAVKVAVGEVTMLVPPGVGVKMHVSRLLGSVNVDVEGRRFTRSGDDWVSDNYATATTKVDVQIDNVIGTINIR